MTLTSHREMFFAHNGPGPYTCCFCNEDVVFRTVVVHHQDHDRTNNAGSNLKPSHDFCHKSHHLKGNTRTKGRVQPTDERRRRSAALEGRVFSGEHRARISASKMGHTVSKETRAKISAALRARSR